MNANNKSSIIKSPDPSLTIHSPKPALSLLHIALETSTKQPSNSSESAAAVLQELGEKNISRTYQLKVSYIFKFC